MTMKAAAGFAAKTAGRISSAVGAVVALVLTAALPVLAETGSGESPDFTVNTVPEPAAMLLALCGVLLLARKARMKATGLMAALLCIASTVSPAFAAQPVVSNVVAVQRDVPDMNVDIYYDVADAEHPTQQITVAVTTNSGAVYHLNTTNVTGDVGDSVAVGTNRHIVWNAQKDIPTCSSTTVRVRVTADDGIPAGMALIPAGDFNMGTNNIPFDEQMTDAGPNHQVYISAFYMDKYEVTYTKWTNVRTWATSHGYTFDNAGLGKATNHPVHTVNWYDCVKWCNARSEMEGLTPCYYTNAAQTLAYRSGAENLSNDRVNWSANGYRLPTEAEWEKAARGGLSGRRFPWQDLNITHTNANYYSDVSYSYDTSTTRGYHPTFNAVLPYTSPAGYFAPNGYGLYDMAGNVWEWTWDWHDSAWYGKAGATVSNTPGPTSGTFREVRGGHWAIGYSRVAYRYNYAPADENYYVGFRSVRR